MFIAARSLDLVSEIFPELEIITSCNCPDVNQINEDVNGKGNSGLRLYGTDIFLSSIEGLD